jgi:peptidoglycan/LPS O-acetylase OafA/YrhL
LEVEPTKRLDELDSLRGLAALVVVFHHFKLLWLQDRMLSISRGPRRIIDFITMPVTAGHEAVILFFVLSGFVLSLPAVNGHAQAYPVFLMRRICRIYLPYVAALMLAIAGNAFFYSDPSQSNCPGACWTTPIGWHIVWQHIVFLGDFDTLKFDQPIWSLVYEMRISLVFPILCALVLKLRPTLSLACAVFISTASLVACGKMSHEYWPQAVLTTVHYAMLFVVGIVLAQHRARIAEFMRAISQRGIIAIALLSILIPVYGGRARQIFDTYVPSWLDISFDWLTACGAAGLILVSLNSATCRRLLLWGPIRSLGKMSYSIYLLHFIVMLALIHLLYGKLPLLLIFAICLPVDIAVSFAFCRFVEIPSIHLGRKISVHFWGAAVS